MKNSKRCPKCGGTRIGVIEGVFDHWTVALPAELLAKFGIELGPKPRTSEGGYREAAAAPASVPKATSQSDLARTAYVCGGCGYYETYVSDPASLEEMGAKGGLRWLRS
jgi:predicted nucleic-acid-binding Zn-ribbon protein